MSKIALSGNASGTGTLTLSAPNTNSDRTLTLPDAAGVVLLGDAVTGRLPDANAPSGSVIQVVSQTFTSLVSATMAGSYADMPGIALSITPSSVNSKILVVASVSYAINDTSYPGLAEIRFRRDSTNFSPVTNSFANAPDGSSAWANVSLLILDSPSSTSPVTYQLQTKQRVTSGANRTVYINGRRDGNNEGSTVINLLEIAA